MMLDERYKSMKIRNQKRFHRPAGIAIALLAAMLTLTGCTSALFSDEGNLVHTIMSDGVVSDAEYRQAKEAVRSCVEEKGWTTSPLQVGYDQKTLNFSIEIDDDESATGDYDHCMDLYGTEVETLYIQQQMLTGAAKQEALTSLWQCFKDIPVDGVLLTDSSKQLLAKTREQYGLDSPEITTAVLCMSAHSFAITDQADPD